MIFEETEGLPNQRDQKGMSFGPLGWHTAAARYYAAAHPAWQFARQAAESALKDASCCCAQHVTMGTDMLQNNCACPQPLLTSLSPTNLKECLEAVPAFQLQGGHCPNNRQCTHTHKCSTHTLKTPRENPAFMCSSSSSSSHNAYVACNGTAGKEDELD